MLRATVRAIFWTAVAGLFYLALALPAAINTYLYGSAV